MQNKRVKAANIRAHARYNDVERSRGQREQSGRVTVDPKPLLSMLLLL
jgi:hypothetical protein